MSKEHIKAIKEVLKSKPTLPILKEVAHIGGVLMATDLTVCIEIKTPNIPDGIYKAEALELGFKEELLDKDYTLDDFPEVESSKVKQELELSGDDLAKIIRASEFVSKDQVRPVLTGVILKNNKIYGTDGYNLYSNRMENEVNDHVVLPAKTVKVLKALKASSHYWTMTVYESNTVAFASGNVIVYSQTISGGLPLFEQIEDDYSVSATITLDLATLKVPKGWLILADYEKNTIYLVDKESENKVEVSKCITLEDGTYTPDERNIAISMMPDDKQVILDPKLLKPYGKHTVKLYMRKAHKGLLEVEIIK